MHCIHKGRDDAGLFYTTDFVRAVLVFCEDSLPLVSKILSIKRKLCCVVISTVWGEKLL